MRPEGTNQWHPLYQSEMPQGWKKCSKQESGPWTGPRPWGLTALQGLNHWVAFLSQSEKAVWPPCWGLKGQALRVLGAWVRIFGESAPRLAPGSLLAVEGKDETDPKDIAAAFRCSARLQYPNRAEICPLGLKS